MTQIKYGEFFGITSNKLEINLVKYEAWQKERDKRKDENKILQRRIATTMMYQEVIKSEMGSLGTAKEQKDGFENDNNNN